MKKENLVDQVMVRVTQADKAPLLREAKDGMISLSAHCKRKLLIKK